MHRRFLEFADQLTPVHNDSTSPKSLYPVSLLKIVIRFVHLTKACKAEGYNEVVEEEIKATAMMNEEFDQVE